MERYEHVFCQRMMEADFIGDMMMKQFVDIEVVGSFRRGRHAQPEPGLEIAEYECSFLPVIPAPVPRAVIHPVRFFHREIHI